MGANVIVPGYEGAVVCIVFTEVLYWVVFAGHGTTPPAGRINRLREWQGLHVIEASFAHVAVNVFYDGVGVQQWRFALLHDNSALTQRQHGVAVKDRKSVV